MIQLQDSSYSNFPVAILLPGTAKQMTIKEMTMDNNKDFNVTINHSSELAVRMQEIELESLSYQCISEQFTLTQTQTS